VFTEISTSTSQIKEEEIVNFFASIEKDLRYLGCSAIEDKLQEVK
jgi:hypothetical protein